MKFTLSSSLMEAHRIPSWIHSIVFLTLLILTTLGLSMPDASAQSYTEQELYAFRSSNGEQPVASLLNVNGILYGTTYYGGAKGYGAIFSIDSATHIETTLYSFTGSSYGDGEHPQAALINVGGILYGTTYNGGNLGYGAVFSFDPSTNVETTLHSFDYHSGDGYNPNAGLIDFNGTLYGTTEEGGSYPAGTIYSIQPNGTNYQIVYNFTKNGDGNGDGAYPLDSLIEVGGILYGTTPNGGVNYNGTIFSFDPATDAETTLYSFGNQSGDVYNAYSSLLAVNGSLYGISPDGGFDGEGAVFSYNLTTNVEKTVYSFQGNSDGRRPYGDLINVNGIIYGTTEDGGSNDKGTVFSFDPKTLVETPVYKVTGGNDGINPEGGLTDVNGTLYGTTQYGGVYSEGTVFSMTPNVVSPVAYNDSYTVKYNTVLTIAAPGVLGNDSSGYASSMTATLVTNPTHGTVTLKSDGSFTYTPTTGYIGTDTFTYQIANPKYTGNTATVTLTVSAVAPTAVNDAYTVKHNTSLTMAAPGVLANDNNGGSAMHAGLVIRPSHGTVGLNADGSFKYTPTTDYAGTDSFGYQAINAIGKSNTATVTLTVTAVAPTAVNDTYAVKRNTALMVAAPGVLANDNNGGSAMHAGLVIRPSHGTVGLNADGSFKYTPTAGFLGTDSFGYQAINAVGKSNTATVTLTVANLPTAANDAYTVKFNTALSITAPGVLANDNNGGSPMHAGLVIRPSHGTVSLNADGSFKYTPTTGFLGTDTFGYQAINAIGKSNTATVTLTVSAVAPTAVNDAYTVKRNTALTVAAPGVLANDNNGGSAMHAGLVIQPAHGKASLNADGSFKYTPTTGFVGTDTFGYQAINAIGKSNTATVTLTVQ